MFSPDFIQAVKITNVIRMQLAEYLQRVFGVPHGLFLPANSENGRSGSADPPEPRASMAQQLPSQQSLEEEACREHDGGEPKNVADVHELVRVTLVIRRAEVFDALEQRVERKPGPNFARKSMDVDDDSGTDPEPRGHQIARHCPEREDKHEQGVIGSPGHAEIDRQQQRTQHSKWITRRELGAQDGHDEQHRAGHRHGVGGFQEPAGDDDVDDLDAGKVEQRTVRQQGDDDLPGRVSEYHERQDRQAEEEGRVGADRRWPAKNVDEGDECDPEMRERHQEQDEIARVEASRPRPDVPKQKSIYDVEPDMDRLQDAFSHRSVPPDISAAVS